VDETANLTVNRIICSVVAPATIVAIVAVVVAALADDVVGCW
jgi:hypothetical protein